MGTTKLLTVGNKNTHSEALKIEQRQRIELRPSVTGSLSMQFTLKETEEVVEKWRDTNQYKLVGGVGKYMHMATSGHSGMIGLLLKTFESYFPQVNILDHP